MMLYLPNESLDVYYDFGLELFLAAEKQLDEPVFLLWRTSPTLMLGRFQNVHEEIDLEYASAHGINLVRRASGGGTIYTDQGGFQFSYIQKRTKHEICFQDFLTPLLAALQSLGLNAVFSGRNDLLLDGKKFSGNAQFVRQGYLVHHGSILFNTDIEQMKRATKLPEYKIVSKSTRSIRERVVNLCEPLKQLGINWTVQEFGSYLVEALSGGHILELSSADYARVHALANSEFADQAKIFDLSPSFTVEKSKQFPSGHVSVQLGVKGGKIESFRIVGDFFAINDVDALCCEIEGALCGSLFAKNEMTNRLANLSYAPKMELFHQINWSQLCELIVE